MNTVIQSPPNIRAKLSLKLALLASTVLPSRRSCQRLNPRLRKKPIVVITTTGVLAALTQGCALPPLHDQHASALTGGESAGNGGRAQMRTFASHQLSNSMGQAIHHDGGLVEAQPSRSKEDTKTNQVAHFSNKAVHPKPKLRHPPDMPSMVQDYDQYSSLIYPENGTGDLWASVASQMVLASLEQHPKIDAEKERLLKNKLHVQRTVERSRRYLHHISSEVGKRNLPMDLVLVPAIESTFDPFAYSSGHASGLWQFVPGTSKWLGMKKTWWYDGRRDVLASTETALDYLEDLNKRFDGDWLHTLAAYNAGATTVHRAIGRNKRKNKPTDFWSLDLPKETRRYVPKILALSKVLNERNLHDLDLPNIADAPYFVSVDTHGQLDLAHAAQLADITVDELYRLNPGFNRWATDPVGPHRLLIPASKAVSFEQRLAKIPADKRMQWARYKVKPGDNLSVLASRFDTRVSVIKSANSMQDNLIKPGQTLLMPTQSLSRHATSLSAQQVASAPNGSKRRVDHIVEPGESLSEIAQRYNVASSHIASWNSMKKNDVLRAGKTLTVWLSASHSITSGQGLMRKVYYTVRNGDSLSQIASRFKIKATDISAWNALQKQRYIKPGQKLTLYIDVTR